MKPQDPRRSTELCWIRPLSVKFGPEPQMMARTDEMRTTPQLQLLLMPSTDYF